MAERRCDRGAGTGRSRDAVAGRSFADVPLGAFLSGGIDSSTVVALMPAAVDRAGAHLHDRLRGSGLQRGGPRPRGRARISAPTYELYVTAGARRSDVIPLLPAIYDEPFADSSQIPTFLVASSRAAGDRGALRRRRRRAVRRLHPLCLDAALWRRCGACRGRCARRLGLSLRWLPPQVWTACRSTRRARSAALRGQNRRSTRGSRQRGRLRRLYRRLLDEWAAQVASAWSGGRGASRSISTSCPEAAGRGPDDVWGCGRVFAGRHSVQGRSGVDGGQPRDPRAVPRPPRRRGRRAHSAVDENRGGQGKLIIRKLLDRYVPGALFDRPKAGFGVPVGEWLKGPLRMWAEELLDAARAPRRRLVRCAAVSARWRDHLSGRRNSTAALWTVLMFQAWLREQGDERRGRRERARAGPVNE